MKSISFTHVALFVICIALGMFFYDTYQIKTTQQNIALKQELINSQLNQRLDSLEKAVNRANSNNAVLAKSVLYLDSCQQTKMVKQDKAERRGRFVGGLLKGLFPGI
jgi:hypothetical protein